MSKNSSSGRIRRIPNDTPIAWRDSKRKGTYQIIIKKRNKENTGWEFEKEFEFDI